jgi:SWI/SNF-related matrix-associated actin-dependent regulator 1 of chromatin subfamily A
VAVDLYPYQGDGRDWLARVAGWPVQRTGLHDEPGIGKTGQCISALDKLCLRRGIVVGPTAIRVNWPREFSKFSMYFRRIVKAKSFNDLLAWQNNHYDVLIVSFEQLTTWARYIHDRGDIFDFIVIDEVHVLKNEAAKRTQQIIGTSNACGVEMWAEYGFALTGTPFPNDPSDCYTQLRFVRAIDPLMTRKQFISEYFELSRATEHSTRYRVKDNKLIELQRMIGANYLRRTADEVGLQLPPLFINPYLVDGDQKPILDMLKQYPGLDKKIVDAANNGSISKVGEFDHIATMRRLIGEAKAIPYAQTILDELTSINPTQKLVVFGIHREALNKARQYLWDYGQIQAVTIDGTNTAAQREELERAYMNNPSIRVCFANIKAGGTALTLTAGHRIDMLETDWVPDNNLQAIKRVHRISQTQSVMCRVITLAGSFDEVVQEIVADKIKNKAPLETRLAA